MTLCTASEVISLARKMENDTAQYYKILCGKFDNNVNYFSNYADENKKNIAQIERTYYSMISDAIEGCFTFEIEPDNYKVNTNLSEIITMSDALHNAFDMEKKISNFYKDAAEQSQSLMADIPTIFMLLVNKRKGRISTLADLLVK